MDRFSRFFRTRIAPAVISIIALAILAGCDREPACATGHDAPMALATLYFGLGLPDGSEVDAASWQRFVATFVTPAFPDGLTVVDATGQWRDPATRRIMAERSKVVTIAVSASPNLARRLDAVREAYRSAFHQQSVGLTIAPVCASFE